jgi:hypothetical protein
MMAVSMALGEIPQTAFEVLFDDPETGRVQYQLYKARAEFLK